MANSEKSLDLRKMGKKDLIDYINELRTENRSINRDIKRTSRMLHDLFNWERINKQVGYLACPYSHPEWEVREHRYIQACRATAKLLADGIEVFSPLSHSHPVSCYGQIDPHWEGWLKFDLRILRIFCHGTFYVLTEDGWSFSKGVMDEFAEAILLDRNIEFLAPDTYEVIKWE